MRHFFLTGTSGIGKSTLLMEVLQEMEFPISGFFAQRQLLPDGTTGGFRLLPWGSRLPLTATYQAEASDLFIKKSDTGWQKDLHVFQTTAITLLNEKTPLKCLDEIGGTELLVPEFLNALYALLESDVYCVGVIKSPQNLTSMMTRVEMKKQEAIKLQKLHKDMTQQFHSVIVELTAFNREEVKLALKNFIKTEVCT